MTTHYANTKDEFLRVIDKVSTGDVVVVPTVRIMGNDADEAFNNFLAIDNKGVLLNPIKEQHLRTDLFVKAYLSLTH